jgi:hypothetical protein
LIIALVLVVSVAGIALFILRTSNPVEDYAKSKQLPPEIIEKLKLLDANLKPNSYKEMIDELSNIAEFLNTSSVIQIIDSMVKDGKITYEELQQIRDIDGDYVSNNLEIAEYHTNPMKIDTDGGGVDDFNEIFTYKMNPNDPKDDAAFMKKIPNVVAEHWNPLDGDTPSSRNKYVNISMRDPLVQYYAKKAEIKWTDNPNGKIGTLFVDGTVIWHGVGEPEERSLDQPSYYLTHERTGHCADSSVTGLAILKLMGHKAITVDGKVPVNNTVAGHEWVEAYIDGKVYVVNFNYVYPREGFYEKYGWTIEIDSSYDPNWYQK